MRASMHAETLRVSSACRLKSLRMLPNAQKSAHASAHAPAHASAHAPDACSSTEQAPVDLSMSGTHPRASCNQSAVHVHNSRDAYAKLGHRESCPCLRAAARNAFPQLLCYVNLCICGLTSSHVLKCIMRCLRHKPTLNSYTHLSAGLRV